MRFFRDHIDDKVRHLIFGLDAKYIDDLRTTARIAGSISDDAILHQIDKNLKTSTTTARYGSNTTFQRLTARLVKIPTGENEKQFNNIMFFPFCDVNDPAGSVRALLPIERGLFVWTGETDLKTAANYKKGSDLPKVELANLKQWIQSSACDDVILLPKEELFRDSNRASTASIAKQLYDAFLIGASDVKSVATKRRILAFFLPVNVGIVASQAIFVRRYIPTLIDDVRKRFPSAESSSLYVILDVGEVLGLTRIEEIVDDPAKLKAVYTGVDANCEPVSCVILHFDLDNE